MAPGPTRPIISNIVVGVLTGLLSSFGVWWWLTHRLKPQLQLSQELALESRANSGHQLRIKLVNTGKRTAVDLTAMWRIRVPALVPGTTATYFSLAESCVPFLDPRDERGRGFSWVLDADRTNTEHIDRYRAYIPEALLTD